MASIDGVGAKVAQMRESRKLTREQLADRAELPVALVKDIEEGAVLPSLAPLIKVARVLGVRLGTFLDDVENVGPVVSRKGHLAKAVRFAGKARASGELDFHALAMDKAGRHMEPFLIDIQPGEEKEFPKSSHEGEEFIYVLGGRVGISYGKDAYELTEGDSIYYDSIVPHHVHALGGEPARILAVVYAPY
jgi:transcriptional regulator with XRE-family HTH domain